MNTFIRCKKPVLLGMIFMIATLLTAATSDKDVQKQKTGNSMSDWEGLKIFFDKEKYKETGEITFHGVFATFVKCGCQYSTWYLFPDKISYILKDLDKGEVYKSVDMDITISHDGNSIYDEYAKEPCDKVVSKNFSINIKEIWFENSPSNEVQNFEISAQYLGYTSNVLIVRSISLKLSK